MVFLSDAETMPSSARHCWCLCRLAQLRVGTPRQIGPAHVRKESSTQCCKIEEPGESRERRSQDVPGLSTSLLEEVRGRDGHQLNVQVFSGP